MTNKEIQEKIAELSKEIDKLGSKIKDEGETIAIKGLYAKDDLEKFADNTKKSLEETKDELKDLSEKSKNKLSLGLEKLEETLKNEKEKLELKKEARDAEKLEKYINNKLDYAKDAVSLSLLAAKEAKEAFLEAVEAQIEYDELYNNKD